MVVIFSLEVAQLWQPAGLVELMVETVHMEMFTVMDQIMLLEELEEMEESLLNMLIP